MKIERCTASDLETIQNLYQNARSYQILKNAVVWPFFENKIILNAIDQGNQFKIVINKQIACVFTFTFEDPQIWGNLDQNDAIYIHKIATNSSFRGLHLVHSIIEFSKNRAVLNNKNFLRMDTVGQNQGLIDYYVACGFKFKGLYKLTNFDALPTHYHNATVSLFEMKV